jgi:sulfoxide reductase heme-binding subunit YedZ|tara:strand:+ start:177 stop:773 length:597 start_codon:yes stop_codon:yes gene_type:complete
MILSTKIVKRSKPVILLLLLLPSMLWSTMFVQGNLGINPIEKLMDELGQMALRLIILTLIISSLSQYEFLRSLQNIRRMIGLTAFYYVVCHFLTYIALDHFFNWKFIVKDIVKRPFITFGFINFILFLPLVLTSTNAIVKKITFKIWKKIHYLIYLIAPLAVLHFYLLTKADKTEPLIYLGIILLLLLWRFYYKILRK